jgi:hypothetical protein
MRNSFSRRLLGVALGTTLAACGSDLTLPSNGSPPVDDGSPAALVVVSGSPQEERVGNRLDEPLVVRVIDASGHPVAEVPVTFAFLSSVPDDAELTPTTATTDDRGEASAEVTLGSTAGDHTVKARLAEQTNIFATFGVTAIARSGRGGGGGGGGGGGEDNDDD